MKCEKCGYENDEDAIFCQECGTRFEGKPLPINTRVSKTDEAQNTVVLAENEIIIREYDVTRVRYSFLNEYNGKLMITNKRVVFYAGSSVGDKTVLETQISSVGPISACLGKTYNRTLLFVSFVLLVLSFFFYGANSNYLNTTGYGVLLDIISAVLYFLSGKEGMYFRIGAINAGPGITLGRGDTVSSSQYCIEGKPGPDAYNMINEFGAIILDLQQIGDMAIEKWKQ